MKRIQLDIMDAIHHFCVKHHIKYSIAYGTLLGAIRHGGYIPWDDDIDIVMLRPDYERFLKEFKDSEGRYLISEARITKAQFFPFAKVHDSHTIWYQKGNNMDTGVFVDIFPLDDLDDTEEESIARVSKYHYMWNFCIAKNNHWGMMTTLKKNIGLMVFKLLYCLKPANQTACNFIEECKSLHNPSSKYVGYIGGKYVKNNIIPRAFLDALRPIKFEDREYLAMQEYDSYLTRTYGDYMKLPPENQRLPHSNEGVYWKEQ